MGTLMQDLAACEELTDQSENVAAKSCKRTACFGRKGFN